MIPRVAQRNSPKEIGILSKSLTLFELQEPQTDAIWLIGDQRHDRRRHCEQSEAIHPSARGAMDCFAALAMTMWLLSVRQINPTGKSPKVCPALA
jgi:hypothetical protein